MEMETIMTPLFELPDAQTIFSLVKEHARKKEPSLVGCLCLCRYRGPNGRKCFAGVLIPDEVYQSRFEEKCWSTLVLTENFPKEHAGLIIRLQDVHDVEIPDEWDTKLAEVAAEFGLKNE